MTAAFVYYQDELKEIWRNNVAVTNSIVLEDADECHLGSTATGLFQTAKKLLIQKLCASKNNNIETENTLIQLNNCCDDLQFIITKVPEWTSKKSNVQQQRQQQQRQKETV